MLISKSLVDDLCEALPQAHFQMYFKSSLTALSHAMEDQVLAGGDRPLVIASFQRERFYRQEAHRYVRIADRTDQVYVLAAPETDFSSRTIEYEMIAFEPEDGLANEWHLVVVGKGYASCLICREKSLTELEVRRSDLHVDQSRRFEGLWSLDRQIVCKAAELLLQRILVYRPELATKIGRALGKLNKEQVKGFKPFEPSPFTDRLVTYLQAGQYKLSKAYRSIAENASKDQLINSMTAAIRRSLNPDEVLQVAVQELGQVLRPSRCLIYRCKATDAWVTIQHEYLANCLGREDSVDDSSVPSLSGMRWTLQDNLLFAQVIAQQEADYLPDTAKQTWLPDSAVTMERLVQTGKIRAWLMVPVLHQNHLLGMIELHFCTPHDLDRHELELVESIAAQIGVALIQAESFANLEDLNQQLAALDRTRSNLIAITGHELRTPLSTIQICLESLASEPDMDPQMRQVMLSSALSDADRMRKLIQDFLTLSRLESGRIEWRLEPQELQECLDLALSSQSLKRTATMPHLSLDLPPNLPLVNVDGEWLVEVLSKLLDNAYKFTPPSGEVRVQARLDRDRAHLEVIIADTGRGIDQVRLETVFERFYQEEGALRRSAGGTGLGLAICRQIIAGWGGSIWAESAGRDRGSAFHFTLPTVGV